MEKYRLYDVYEGKIKIGEYNTKKEVAKACNEYTVLCDNECDFALYQLDNEIGKYKLIRNWYYITNTIVIKEVLK